MKKAKDLNNGKYLCHELEDPIVLRWQYFPN